MQLIVESKQTFCRRLTLCEGDSIFGSAGRRWEMRVLVLGGGGREHALLWKLKQSPLVEKIWCVPGNAGIEQDAECIAADPADVAKITELATRLNPDLTVVGPEQPLVNGIADAL